MTRVKSLAERLVTMPGKKRWEIGRRATQWVEDGGPDAERGAEALEDIAVSNVNSMPSDVSPSVRYLGSRMRDSG